MYDFEDLDGFLDHLSMVVMPNVPTALAGGLDEVGREIEELAVKKFGEYQPKVGPFPAWPSLAPSTKEDRVSKGFSEDEPLYRTGRTRDSIKYHVDGDNVVVGSSEVTMVYHEMGTTSEPPRPVLGPAMYQSKHRINEILGRATVLAIVPGLMMEKVAGFRSTGKKLTNPRYNKYRR